jgi:hypothetical protein
MGVRLAGRGSPRQRRECRRGPPSTECPSRSLARRGNGLFGGENGGERALSPRGGARTHRARRAAQPAVRARAVPVTEPAGPARAGASRPGGPRLTYATHASRGLAAPAPIGIPRSSRAARGRTRGRAGLLVMANSRWPDCRGEAEGRPAGSIRGPRGAARAASGPVRSGPALPALSVHAAAPPSARRRGPRPPSANDFVKTS